MTILNFVTENADFIKKQTISRNVTMLAWKKGVSLNSSIKLNTLKKELLNIGVDYNSLNQQAASSDATEKNTVPVFGGNGATIDI